MKPLNLILDYTKATKEHRNSGEPWSYPEADKTILMAYYPHSMSDDPNVGEHCATFPEVRTPEAGRKAAKTFMKYCECNFIDKTKE